MCWEVEEAWELVAVSDKISTKDVFIRMLRKPGFLGALLGILFIQFGFLLMTSSGSDFESPLIKSFVEFFSVDVGSPERLILWPRVIGSILAILGMSLLSIYYVKFVGRTASSPDERAYDETAYELRNLQREFRKFSSENSNTYGIETQIKEILAKQQSLLSFDINELNEGNWSKVFLTGRERLLRETVRLSARSRLNLTAGVVISSISVAYLTYFVFSSNIIIGSEKPYALISYYVPRLSLILIIQVLASFFLRMYVVNERSIQRNKNEITNLELRLAAGLLVGSSSQKAKLADKLISEERNFVLDKKEKTAESATKETSEILKNLQNLIKSLKP